MIFRATVCVAFIALSANSAFAIDAAVPKLDKTNGGGELTAIAPTATAAEPVIEYNIAVLRGLNKVTGHTSKLEGPVNTVMKFGTLEIVAKRCWKASPEERPENAVLLDITETKAEEGPQKIFTGWMFSSSPGLSGLENAVYDINVISCETTKAPEKPAETPVKKEPAPKKKRNNGQ